LGAPSEHQPARSQGPPWVAPRHQARCPQPAWRSSAGRVPAARPHGTGPPGTTARQVCWRWRRGARRHSAVATRQ